MNLIEREKSFTKLGPINEEIETYHANPGLSFSGLKKFAITPAHYLASKLEPSEEETGSQRLGTLAHMAILERDKFETKVQPVEGHRGKTEIKERISALEAQGIYVCKPDEYTYARKIAEAVFKSPTARKLLSGGVAEQSIYWNAGALLKCRPDYYRPDGVVVDLKTFSDLSEFGIQKQIHRMKYHWQSAFYLTGVNQLLNLDSKMFVHIFLDTTAYVCRTVVLDDASLEKAQEEIKPLMDQYYECLTTNQWPGYPDEVLTMNLPSYAW